MKSSHANILTITCRRAVELEPLQPLMQKYISFLEAEVLPSTSEHSRPRVQLKRTDIWLGFKSLYVSLTHDLQCML